MSTLTITLHDYDEDTEQEHTLPARWDICAQCRGNGALVNPNIDGHGLSREDFDEDPDFEEGYFAGRYDVTCSACKGSGKLLVPDMERMTDAQRMICERWEEQQTELRRDRAADAYTRRMENGGC